MHYLYQAMKWLSIILVLCLFVLTVQPVVSDVYAMAKHHACCDRSCCKDKQGPAKCMPETCNTCASCTSCLGFFDEQAGFKFTKEKGAKVFTSTDTEKLVSDYIANCFQPPEMV